MSTDFSQLKKQRKKLTDKLKEDLNKTSQGGGHQKDDRYWQPEVDKAGNGYAVIRFLPAPKGEEVPYVRMFSHGFKGPNGWYIENSLTTLGKNDPVSEINSTYWNSGIESDKEIARKQKRKLGYISNILVVKDSANPQNEGKVFLYRYGKKIFDKLNDAMNPQFEDDEAINPFDFWDGANFRIKIRNVEGYRNYDQSSFDRPSVLSDDDEELEKIWEQEYSLQAEVAPDKFKTYDELKSRLHAVLGLDGSASASRTARAEDVDTDGVAEASEMKTRSSRYESDDESEQEEAVDDDDDLAAFRKLAETD